MDTEAQAAPETGAERDDVHADVRAAIESLSKPETETTAVEPQGDSRPRNENGQFTKAESAETQQAAITTSDADPARDTVQQPSTAMDAPTSWSADAKSKWATLDPSIQAEIARREKNMSEGGQKWSEEKRQFQEVLSPVEDMARATGLSTIDGVRAMMNVEARLRNPTTAAMQIAQLAEAYGVDLSNLEQTLQDRPKVDPELSRLSQELNSLKSSIQDREFQEINAELSRFASSHEHFEKVRVPMGKLMAQGLASSMDEAYDKAIWADPELRPTLIASQNSGQQTQQKQREQADRAKRAALSVTGSPAAVVPVQKQEYATVEEAARAAARQHGWAI